MSEFGPFCNAPRGERGNYFLESRGHYRKGTVRRLQNYWRGVGVMREVPYFPVIYPITHAPAIEVGGPYLGDEFTPGTAEFVVQQVRRFRTRFYETNTESLDGAMEARTDFQNATTYEPGVTTTIRGDGGVFADSFYGAVYFFAGVWSERLPMTRREAMAADGKIISSFPGVPDSVIHEARNDEHDMTADMALMRNAAAAFDMSQASYFGHEPAIRWKLWPSVSHEPPTDGSMYLQAASGAPGWQPYDEEILSFGAGLGHLGSGGADFLSFERFQVRTQTAGWPFFVIEHPLPVPGTGFWSYTDGAPIPVAINNSGVTTFNGIISGGTIPAMNPGDIVGGYPVLGSVVSFLLGITPAGYFARRYPGLPFTIM